MTFTEQKYVSKAKEQLIDVQCSNGDERQVWINDKIWYLFSRSGRGWRLLEVETYSDNDLDKWDNPWKYDLRYVV